tara:strand:- start:38293 stop:38496 length:204 start_codon:yes stop_codon:yes gene_type:complete
MSSYYKAVRYYAPNVNKSKRTIKSLLTLEEAQAYASRPESSLDHNGGKFFVGYDHMTMREARKALRR